MTGSGDQTLLARVRKRCEGYPLDAQRGVTDPVVCAKLYWPIGIARWYIIGYNPETDVAYGFVVGVGRDEWGYFSVESLLETLIAGVMPVRLDDGFVPTRASVLGIAHHAASA